MKILFEPTDSPYVAAVLAAVEGLGSAGNLHVVDRARAPHAPADGQTVVIGEADEPEAFDVVAPTELARLPRVLRAFARSAALHARLAEAELEVASLDEVGRALSDVTDLHALLATILGYARKLCSADAGSIYLVEDDGLRFAASANDTVELPLARPRVPLDPTSLAGWVAVHGQILVLADVRALPPDAPFHFNDAFDQATGYWTRSMMLVPLRGRSGDVLGVLALLNRKPLAGAPLRDFSVVVPFEARQVRLARSIASSASVALDNHRLFAESQRLFDGFVEAAVAAIEDRDPATGGHSQRVATLTLRLAEAMSETSAYAHLAAPQALTELRYAALLHDFGKVSVREDVLRKAGRVHAWELLETELRLFTLLFDELAGAPLTPRARAALEVERSWLHRLNDPRHRLTDADRARLGALEDRLARAGLGGESILRRFGIHAGTLDERERQEMRLHVTCSWRFLSRIPWTQSLRGVPEIAWAHHEKLDGSGYPRRLQGDAIPLGAQLMAIADIFDAVTAFDRPYRDGVSPEHAVAILRLEASEGKLLAPAVELFAGRRLWEGVTG